MRVLLVEDDLDLRESLLRLLTGRGFAVDCTDQAAQAQTFGLTRPYDAVVLDLGLADGHGVDVLHHWRCGGCSTPVLVLTARGRWSDKLAAFNAGADDYLTKPFEAEEVVLRLRALIRRAAGHAMPVLSLGPLALDTTTGAVTVNGLPLHLTPQEFRILQYLMHHPGRIVSRGQIIDHVYDQRVEQDSNVVDVLLGRIRRKLPARLIHTVRGRGYRLALPD